MSCHNTVRLLDYRCSIRELCTVLNVLSLLQYEAALQFLLETGVDERRASEALMQTDGDIDTALAILFADPRSQ